MGVQLSREEAEFNEKRLYIFVGFDDYPIATLDGTKITHFYVYDRYFYYQDECLSERSAYTYLDGAWMHRKVHI